MNRFVVVPASYAFLLRGPDDDPDVLLQLRRNTGYMDGHWAAGAAGHVERGETAYDAARREAFEELGIGDLELSFELTMQRTQGADPIDERVDFFFTSRSWTGEPTVQEPAKCADLRWFPLSRLPDPVVPHERLALGHLGTTTKYLTQGFAAGREGTAIA
jgi:8-oxo-dGTP pyrophosphatase MutT (NUDIX family)